MVVHEDGCGGHKVRGWMSFAGRGNRRGYAYLLALLAIVVASVSVVGVWVLLEAITVRNTAKPLERSF